MDNISDVDPTRLNRYRRALRFYWAMLFFLAIISCLWIHMDQKDRRDFATVFIPDYDKKLAVLRADYALQKPYNINIQVWLSNYYSAHSGYKLFKINDAYGSFVIKNDERIASSLFVAYILLLILYFIAFRKVASDNVFINVILVLYGFYAVCMTAIYSISFSPGTN